LYSYGLWLIHTAAKKHSDFPDATLGYPAPATFQANNQRGSNAEAVGELYLRQV
jgi:hypothetical protein